jgi:MFS family permease
MRVLIPGPGPFSPPVISPLVPDPADLPGADVLKSLTNGIAAWALIAALIGVVVGAVIWAFGHYGQNYHQAYNGRKGLLVSGAAALIIGAAPAIINFFNALGMGMSKGHP